MRRGGSFGGDIMRWDYMATELLRGCSRAPMKLHLNGAKLSHAFCHGCVLRDGAMSHTVVSLPSTSLILRGEKW